VNELMEIEPSKLVVHVLIVSLSTLGIVEWLKNFIKPKKKKMYAILALFILSICVTAQFALNNTHTMWFNLFTLGCAVLQFGHTALVKVPEMMINKAIGVKDEKRNQGDH